MSEPESPTLNPWIRMWVHPRTTIQWVVDSNPRRRVLILAGLMGVAGSISILLPTLHSILGWPLGLSLGVPTVMLTGIGVLYLVSVVLGWTGRWIGGLATDEKLRAALAWSGIPMVGGLLFWIPRSVWIEPWLRSSGWGARELMLVSGFLFFDLMLNVWATVLLLGALAQVQGFSAGKALANLALAACVLAVPLILVGTIWMWFG